MREVYRAKAPNALDQYFQDVNQYPLLKPEEERELGMLIVDGRMARARLNSEVGELQEDLLCAVKMGAEARGHLTEANLRLVPGAVKQFLGFGLPFSDLIQEGNLGLMRAVERFDPEMSRFSTFAVPAIQRSAIRALPNQGRTIEIPSYFDKVLFRISMATKRLSMELGCEPTDEEIALELHLPVKKVTEYMRLTRRPVSLEDPIEGEEGRVYGDVIPDKVSPDPYERAEKVIFKEELEDLLESALGPREERILRARFGLYPYDHEHESIEIAHLFGLGRRRINYIIQEALDKLRNNLHTEEIKEFL